VDLNSEQYSNIINEQKEIIYELSELYSPGSQLEKLDIKIGDRVTTVYSFHYPPHSFAFSVKCHSSKMLSFIDKHDTQLLRKWTIKAVLIVSIKHVSQYLSTYHVL
jgi:hypothetical protein